MVAQFIAALERPVSRVRLENYRNGGDDLTMIVNYFYNIALSEALYPPLQAFEVALRNSIHSALSTHFRTPYWFDQPAFLPNWQAEQVVKARVGLVRAGKSATSDRVVAELHVGFWHSMLNSPFERELWRPNRSRLIGEVFPNSTRKARSRQVVWDHCDRIRKLRNRVMHYEPIWSRPTLKQDHEEILHALRWISIDMFDSITMFGRFIEVLETGRLGVEHQILEEIGKRSPGS